MKHGQQRLGYVTASVAKIVMSGGQDAWASLSKRMWADDGSEFGQAARGARAFGHEQEPFGIAKFWERHPELEPFDDAPPFIGVSYFVPYGGERVLIGCSPDRVFTREGTLRRVGIQVKSPVERGTFLGYNAYCSRNEVPPEHRDQVQHELLVLDSYEWCSHEWYFVTHHGDDYAEARVQPDERWREEYLKRLVAFWKFHNENVIPERTKLGSATDIGRI